MDWIGNVKKRVWQIHGDPVMIQSSRPRLEASGHVRVVMNMSEFRHSGLPQLPEDAV